MIRLLLFSLEREEQIDSVFFGKNRALSRRVEIEGQAEIERKEWTESSSNKTKPKKRIKK